jgi:eukaryotic-like serine/threonine-protein kinase
MAADPARVQAAFLAAVEQTDPANRAAVLARECGPDAELRGRVEALLFAGELPDNFLDRPAIAPLAGFGATEDSAPAVGTVLEGRYKLLEVIGEGGMGTVWLAEQTEPVHRKVALKVIKTGMDTAEVVARFEAERQALALMDHPNIAKVLDAGGTPQGRPYFVMELVKGSPITKYCDECHLTPKQRLELFVPVCKAIQHAHQKGVIHRDLKPSNVLVAPYDGRPVPKVIDFGVAKAAGQPLTELTLVTGLGAVVGTLEYMSPEQAELNNVDVDTRTDIYSLGVLLYEQLTGTTPLQRGRLKQVALLEMLRVIREEEPPRPSTRLSVTDQLPRIAANRGLEPRKLSGIVRGELDWIVMKALEKDRARRYQTANGLAMDVQRYLADEPVQACPPSAGYRFRKFARKNRVEFTTIGLVMTALVLGTAISAWQAVRATRAEDDAAKGWAGEKLGRERAVTGERTGKQRLFEARLAQARAGRKSGVVGQRTESLKAITEAVGLAEELGLEPSVRARLRDEAIACLGLTDLGSDKEWQGWSSAYAEWVGFDPELRHYARSDFRGTITVHPVGEVRELARVGDPGRWSYPVIFSPQGDLLLSVAQTAAVWDWRRQSLLWRCPHRDVHADAVAFHPNNRQIAVGRGNGTVSIFDLQTAEELRQFKLDVRPTRLAFAPDGTKLAVASFPGKQVQVHDLETGDAPQTWDEPAGPYGVAWHPSGQLLAIWTEDFGIHIWNAQTGVEQTVLRGHQTPVVKAGFSPSGDRLWSWSWDGTTRLWDLCSGRELVRVSGTHSHLSRDGRKLVCRRGNQFLLWDVIGGEEYFALPGSDFGTKPDEQLNRGGHLSPDGRLLAVGGTNGVRLLDLASGRSLAVLPTGPCGARFDPRGRSLFTFNNTVHRWPLRLDQGTLHVGPPESLGQSATGLALDATGSRAIFGQGRPGAVVIDLNKPEGAPRQLNHLAAIYVDLSPDGRWAATGNHNGAGAKVWDATTGRLVHDLLTEFGNVGVRFRPDGRQLVTANQDGLIFWETETWTEQRRIPTNGVPAVAWDMGGKLMAYTPSRFHVELQSAATGRALATLEATDDLQVLVMALTPAGDRLAVWSGRPSYIRVWDLRLVRSRLAEMGLDWDMPPYGPAAPKADSLLRIEVEPGDLTEKK